MTTRGFGTDGDDEGRTVVIATPEELIASVPAMLGFPPGPGSMVVICGRLADGGQGPVVRVDVPGLLAESPGYDDDPSATDDAGRDEEVVRGLAGFCAREQVSGVHLVVVHENCADDPAAGSRARDAADVFDFWLGAAGTAVTAAYGVGEFGAGAPWADLFGMACGAQMDPDSTEIAAVYAFDGRMRAASRGEIERIYLDRDPDACEVEAHGRGLSRLRGKAAIERAVALHDAAAEHLGQDGTLTDPELADVGVALLDIAVRDEVYAGLARRGLGDEDGRRRLWWAVARRRPGRERSVALTLLGAAAYFAGSGVHARSAFDAAIRASADNNLAGLLLEGLDRGIAPERLRRLALTAA